MTKECINYITLCYIRDIIDNVWFSIAENNERVETADFTAPFMEICGALYLADKLKNVIDE